MKKSEFVTLVRQMVREQLEETAPTVALQPKEVYNKLLRLASQRFALDLRVFGRWEEGGATSVNEILFDVADILKIAMALKERNFRKAFKLASETDTIIREKLPMRALEKLAAFKPGQSPGY